MGISCPRRLGEPVSPSHLPSTARCCCSIWGHLLALWRPEWAVILLAGLDVNPLSSPANTFLFGLMNALRIVVVLHLWVAALRLRFGHSSGWEIAHRGLVLSVIAADVIAFYFSQFSAATIAVVDVLLLNAVNHVRHYLLRQTARQGEAPALLD